MSKNLSREIDKINEFERSKALKKANESNPEKPIVLLTEKDIKAYTREISLRLGFDSEESKKNPNLFVQELLRLRKEGIKFEDSKYSQTITNEPAKNMFASFVDGEVSRVYMGFDRVSSKDKNGVQYERVNYMPVLFEKINKDGTLGLAYENMESENVDAVIENSINRSALEIVNEN